MAGYEVDFREAARLEQEGDAAMARGRPAAEFYRAAQAHLMPCGRSWTDRQDEYERHMAAFERLQEKLCQLDLQWGALDPVEVENPPGEPEPIGEWLELAMQRQFEEAARLLAPRASILVGPGYYASRGHRVEDAAGEALKNGDPWAARISYEEALENYLLYSMFPAGGDSVEAGYELAGRVVSKLEQLD